MANKMTYMGLDVHDETILAAWQVAGMAKVKSEVFEHNEKGIAQLTESMKGRDVWAAYETSGTGFLLYDKLTEAGWKVSVLATTRLPKSVRSRKKKNDLRDALMLKDQVMAHGECGTELPDVWIPPVKTREDREIVRRRLQLADDVSKIKTQIKSMLKIHGRKWDGKTSWSKKHREWLRELSEAEGKLGWSVRVSLASQLRMLEATEAEEKILENALEKLSQETAYQAPAKAVMDMKGVGLLTGMTFLLELGDVERFGNRQQLGSYLGLTPTSHESGAATDRKGHITRMGPPRIRKVLNQAAWTVLRCYPEWKQAYVQLRKRRGGKRAVVAIMRKLGIVLWHRALRALGAQTPPQEGVACA